jgi:hypothetical protein
MKAYWRGRVRGCVGLFLKNRAHPAFPGPSARRMTSADVLGALRDWTGGFNAGRHMMAGVAAAAVVGILLLNRYGQRQMPREELAA